MGNGFYRTVIAALMESGFSYQSNAKGSDEKWVNAHGLTLTVPRNLNSRHTANGILKAAGSKTRV